MARVLYDGLVEYEDGTPASTSQMAKDVVEFLNWAAEPEMDDRKKMGWKVVVITSVLYALSIWMKRYVVRPNLRTVLMCAPAGTNGLPSSTDSWSTILLVSKSARHCFLTRRYFVLESEDVQQDQGAFSRTMEFTVESSVPQHGPV